MRLSESIRIQAPSSVVWDAVSNPDCWPGFVSKIQEVERLDSDFYRILIGNKEVIGKIAHRETYRRLQFAGQLSDQPKRSEFLIEYQLQEKPKHVVVFEIQEFYIPFPANLLVKFLFNFGKPKSKTNLQHLKELCESRSHVG